MWSLGARRLLGPKLFLSRCTQLPLPQKGQRSELLIEDVLPICSTPIFRSGVPLAVLTFSYIDRRAVVLAPARIYVRAVNEKKFNDR